MLHLTLAGLSEDNKRLLLVSDSGEEFSLTIDRRLRAALRGEHARLGQLEIQMESTLRPRDIQSRIRAGESPESVAQAAQTTVERIMPFASPVLAERAHVAERAQRASVRRKAGDVGARTLGEAVTAQLGSLNLSGDLVEWDSWRREDGRWVLTGDYSAGKRKGTAKFVFDAPGNYVTTENDDAKWLVGEQGGAAGKPARRDEVKQARKRRLSAVPEEELPLGDDALELANESAPEPEEAVDETPGDEVSTDDESTVDLTDTAEQIRAADSDDDPSLSPTPEPLAEPPAQAPAAETEPDVPESDPAQDTDDEPKPAPKPRKPKKKGRASVPSWDEIMFGGGKQE